MAQDQNSTDAASQTIRIDIPPDFLKKGASTQARRTVVLRKPREAEPGPAPAAAGGMGQGLQDQNFQGLFQRVYDGALIADFSGHIVDGNQRAVEFLYYDREELRSLRIPDIISGSTEETLAKLRTNLQKDLFTLIQAYCARKDGTLFPAEIAVNRLQLSGQDYLCFFIRDIAWRKQAEELLRTEHTAIQNSGNGIAIASAEGQLEYVNPALARLWGYGEPKDLLGHGVGELLVDATLTDGMKEAAQRGDTWSGQAVGRRRDGGEFHVQISAVANRDADDILIGMVLSFVDISDAKRAEEAERQSERQKIMMESLGTACHHLGQPATVILTSMEVMQKLLAGNHPDPLVKDLLSSGMQAAETLRDLLLELNSMTEYKTRPYLEGQSGTAAGETRILDF